MILCGAGKSLVVQCPELSSPTSGLTLAGAPRPCQPHGSEGKGEKKERKEIIKIKNRGFPGGAVVENLPANAGDTGSSPGLGGSHMPRSN